MTPVPAAKRRPGAGFSRFRARAGRPSSLALQEGHLPAIEIESYAELTQQAADDVSHGVDPPGLVVRSCAPTSNAEFIPKAPLVFGCFHRLSDALVAFLL